MLTKEQKNKWVEALRSGKYKQTFGGLRNQDAGGYRYCCLGVLEQVCPANGVEPNFFSSDAYRRLGKVELDAYDLVSRKLWMMNDKGRMSFSEIANWIEKNLETRD